MIKAIFNKNNPPFIYLHSVNKDHYKCGISIDYKIPESNIIRRLYFDPIYYDDVKKDLDEYLNKIKCSSDIYIMNDDELNEFQIFMENLYDSEILGKFKFLDDKIKSIANGTIKSNTTYWK